MSKWEKLLSKIYSLDNAMRFEELRKVLEDYGYKMTVPNSGSSHHTFRKKGKNPLTIPKHEPIKKKYVEMVRNIVDEEEKDEDN